MTSKEQAKRIAGHKMVAAQDKLSELAEDPRRALPFADPAYQAWYNETKVARRVYDHAKTVWEGI
jgi:hypothetical protein